MRNWTLLYAGLVLAFCAVPSGSAFADVLHQFSTPDATLNPDDGYDPAVVTIAADPNVIAPANGTALQAGSTGLARFWNTEWAGFSLSSANGTTLDNETEFDTGYLTWTVSAAPGHILDLTSLAFDSARGGGDPATQVRRFELYAEVDGGAFAFGDVPLLAIDNETGTRTAPVPRLADLSGETFQGISSITFRYYPLTPATGNTMDFGTVTLNGLAVIPEPAGLSLLGLAGIALLRRGGGPRRA